MMKQKRTINFFSFTLLELCICFLILTLISALLGWQLKNAIDYHQFKNCGNELCAQIRHLQALATSYQIDADLKIVEDEEKIIYQKSTDEPLDIINKSKIGLLKGISTLTFNNKPVKEIHLRIFSNGRITPQGVLGMHRKDFSPKDSSLWIDIRFPIQIKVVKDYPEK
jgi:hypothetical protein